VVRRTSDSVRRLTLRLRKRAISGWKLGDERGHCYGGIHGKTLYDIRFEAAVYG
jgi:hypothetical protein